MKDRKVLVIVGIGLFLFLCICCAVSAFTSWYSFVRVDLAGLTKVDKSAYLFYYPESFEDINNDGSLEQAFQNSNESGILLFNDNTFLEGDELSSDKCDELQESIIDNAKEDATGDATGNAKSFVEVGEVATCNITFTIDIDSVATTYSYKIVQSGDEYFTLIVAYNADDTKEDIKFLKNAFKAFKLK